MTELVESDFPSLTKAPQAEEDWELLNRETVEEAEAKEATMSRANKKVLFHCASSPDLRKLHKRLADEDDESFQDMDAESESFSFISKPVTPGFSFRDAILKRSQLTDEAKQDDTKEPKPQQKFTPTIVVKPIKRVAKSSPDLRSLGEIDEDDILGETDAGCFYSQKAMGSSGRQKGLKLRPDEAKRKAMIVNKKNEQRAKQRGQS